MRISRLLAVITAAVILCTNAEAKEKESRIVAHRGFWNCEEAGYAKNSVAALRCAQEAGFWGSEFDVNMTSNGVLLVYHDSRIDGKKIEKHPYADFKEYKIKNGESIPTIDEYLEQGKKYPETMLVYELKKHSCRKVEDRFVDLTIEKLKEHGLLDPQKVMFISFSFHICQRLAERLPEFTVQFLSGNRQPSKVKSKGINGIDYRYTVFGRHPKWAAKAHGLGMNTNSWTVNKESDMTDMLELGIQAITTDYPLVLREVMKVEGYKELR